MELPRWAYALDRETIAAYGAILGFFGLGLAVLFVEAPNRIDLPTLDTGATAWLLSSTALVLFMTPGLAFFYGGMVNRKSILYTMFQSISAMAVVTVLWVAIGFSLAFGDSVGGVIGNPWTFFMYRGVGAEPNTLLAPGIPFALFSIFQLKFCIISGPIVSGAFTERIAILPYLIYLVLFSIIVYCPVAHSVWHPDGFLRKWGVIDFAGGLVVETCTGYSALAGAYIFNHDAVAHPHGGTTNPHIPFIVLGTSVLWFGWFGFNSGSAMAANGLAVQSFLNTHCAGAAAMITWLLIDKVNQKKPSMTAACVGSVVGLVCITPACGYVNTGGAFLVGMVGALVCNPMCSVLKRSPYFDDQLEVWPAHGLGGTVGTIMTGLLADKRINSGLVTGGLIHGGSGVFLKNLAAAAGVALWAYVMSYFLFKVIGSFMDLKVSHEKRMLGLDVSFHGETIVWLHEDEDGIEVVEKLSHAQKRKSFPRLPAHREEGEEKEGNYTRGLDGSMGGSTDAGLELSTHSCDSTGQRHVSYAVTQHVNGTSCAAPNHHNHHQESKVGLDMNGIDLGV